MSHDIERQSADSDASVTSIEFCGRHPCWLDCIARWQAEASSNGESASTLSETAITARLQTLEQQCVDERIPVTYVAHRQGQPLGCISLVEYPRLGGMPPSYWIANVFVDESQRCEGLASEMLLVMEALAEAEGISELYLYATDQVGYYRNRGWQEVSRKNIRGCETTIMRKFLCVSS
jgi:N-acetylglutamate synthase-like GNAT family acetyltransferase